jgi:hypothetical protein
MDHQAEDNMDREPSKWYKYDNERVEYLPDRILRRGVIGTILEAERGLAAGQVSKLHPHCLCAAFVTADTAMGR